MLLLYSGKVWQGKRLANWLFLSLWWKKVWWISRSANRLFIVSTNLDGLVWQITDNSPNFPAAKHSRFTVYCHENLLWHRFELFISIWSYVDNLMILLIWDKTLPNMSIRLENFFCIHCTINFSSSLFQDCRKV